MEYIGFFLAQLGYIHLQTHYYKFGIMPRHNSLKNFLSSLVSAGAKIDKLLSAFSYSSMILMAHTQKNGNCNQIYSSY